MRALPPDAQRGVLGLMESKGGQIRGQMAHQAARADSGDGRCLPGGGDAARGYVVRANQTAGPDACDPSLELDLNAVWSLTGAE
jgi:hypothetical protein